MVILGVRLIDGSITFERFELFEKQWIDGSGALGDDMTFYCTCRIPLTWNSGAARVFRPHLLALSNFYV